jgi:hypothetical protein
MRLSIRSSFVVAAVLGAAGCNVEVDPATESGERGQELIPRDQLPLRPILGPGESNWLGQSKTFRPAQLVPGEASKKLKSPLYPEPQYLAAIGGSCISTLNLASQTPADLVSTILGSGAGAPAVSNIHYTGRPHSGGTFSGAAAPIGFESGIILSSGNIAAVSGPNVQDDVTTDNGLPGDPDLNGLIPGFTTLDATVLEFDFECPGADTLTFEYVFSSDEYNEYVKSDYNDVFGFFVNGSNVALIPGTSTPVSINNVNCNNPFSPPSGSHCDLFRNNDLSNGGGSICTEMDGLTVPLTATATVHSGTNHIRLAVADAGDHILDSNIFLKSGSFTCNRPPHAACKDVTVSANAVCAADASIDNGSSDPDGDQLTCTQTPAGPYAEGSTSVTLTCTDPLGKSDSCTGSVTVVDDTAPTIVCPSNQTAECVSGGATVNYGNATASDNCGVASVGCAPPSGTFGLGNTSVSCTATDTSSNSSTCGFNVAVVDTIPPVVTVSPQGAGDLWPPDHKYISKSLFDCGVQILDQCQGVIDLQNASPTITCVTSDEVENGGGDGNTLADMIIVDATTVLLRSERSGPLVGRVYGIHFKVTDAAGNVGTGVCQVGVPHDQGNGQPAVDSGVHFTVGNCN